jgi:hypothetical protein
MAVHTKSEVSFEQYKGKGSRMGNLYNILKSAAYESLGKIKR